MPIATAITAPSCQPSVLPSTTTRAIAGAKNIRTKSTNRRYCGPRIGTDATQNV